MVNSGPYDGLTSAAARRRMTADAEAAGFGSGLGAVSAEGLGHLATALLGHADPDDPLPGRRRRRRAGRGPAGRAAQGRRIQRPRRLAAGACAGVRRRHLSDVRRAGAPRDRHDGHVRRLVVVLLPLRRRPQRSPAVRPGQGEVLVPGRLLLGRRRARDPAPDLLALLRAGVPRPRDDRSQRAVHPPADAGHGAEGRPRDVEVEGQRRRSRHDAGQGRRRRPAALRDVRRPAGEGGRMERLRPGRQLPLAGPGLAGGPAVARGGRRRGADCRA